MTTTRNKTTMIESSHDKTITGVHDSEYISLQQVMIQLLLGAIELIF